jgi:hypothetical protein
MKTVHISETSVYFHETTRRYAQESCHLRLFDFFLFGLYVLNEIQYSNSCSFSTVDLFCSSSLQQTKVKVSEARKVATKAFRKIEAHIYILVVPVKKYRRLYQHGFLHN